MARNVQAKCVLRAVSQNVGPKLAHRMSISPVLMLAVLICAACGSSTRADQANPPAAYLVSIPLPIDGTVDTRVKQAIDKVLDAVGTRTDRPALVLKFEASAKQNGSLSQFERSLSLARFLADSRMGKVRTVAWLPATLKGHALIVAMACEEIVMPPNAELGEAGLQEDNGRRIPAEVRGAYLEIATRRRTIVPAMVLGMLDRKLVVYKLETNSGTRFETEADYEKLKQEKTVVIDKADTIKADGTLGLYTGRMLREQGFVSNLAENEQELAAALKVPLADLKQSPTGDWIPVRVDVKHLNRPDALASVQRQIEAARNDKQANLIVLFIDSAGGPPLESEKLARYLAELPQSEVRTVAYISHEARGDTALIALACDDLVMHPNATLGGAGIYEPSLAEAAALQAAMKHIAVAKRRSWSLPLAMIDRDLVVGRYALAGTDTVGYFSEEELRGQKDPAQWSKVAEEKKLGELYSLTGDKAEQIGVARYRVENVQELRQFYNLSDDLSISEPGWGDAIIEFLNRREIRGVLITIALVALMIEFMAPGIGVAAFVSAVCFAIYFWAAFLGGTSGVLEIILFLLGISCLLLEIFVLPGMGVFGIGGALLVLVSLILASQTMLQFPTNEYQWAEFNRSLLTVGLSIFGAIAGIAILRRYVRRAPLFRHVMLEPEVSGEELSRRESMVQLNHLLGELGETATPLTPAGKATIGGQLVDVVSDGEFISRGSTVQVIEVLGNRVVVKGKNA